MSNRESDSSPMMGSIGTFAARIGFLAAGSHLFLIAERLWFATNYLWGIEPVLLSFGVFVLACLLLIVGLLSRLPVRQQWMILAALLITLGADYYQRAFSSNPRDLGTDSALYSIYGSDLLLAGQNPYEIDMSNAYDLYNISDYYRTPQMTGSFVARMPYPALHFLVFTPLRMAGVWDIRLLYLAAHGGLLVLLFLGAPPELRGLILMPLYTNPRYLEYTYGAVSDVIWVVVAVAMIFAWRRPFWRAVLYGLACAYKQTPWLLAPFILIRLLLDEDDPAQQSRLWRAGAFFGVAGGVFLLFNGPFILLDPNAWWKGALEPLFADYIYFGSGLSTLTQLGILPLTRTFYSFTTLVVLMAVLLLYALRFRQLKPALWILPAVILWFSYRSLHNYFVYWIPLLLAEAANLTKGPWKGQADIGQSPAGIAGRLSSALRAVDPVIMWAGARLQATKPLASGVVIVVALALIIGLAGYSVSVAVPLQVEVTDLSMNVDLDQISEIEIRVTNTLDRAISPYITVGRVGWQPYPWDIVGGPATLTPGESGIYRVRTDIDYRMFRLGEGAQVVVGDASGDYAVRGTTRVRVDIYQGP